MTTILNIAETLANDKSHEEINNNPKNDNFLPNCNYKCAFTYYYNDMIMCVCCIESMLALYILVSMCYCPLDITDLHQLCQGKIAPRNFTSINLEQFSTHVFLFNRF